ncbi:MAG: hypothetical protein Q9201_003434 [Fulgogasparrea decipioides]
MPWPGFDYYNDHPPVLVAARPGRGRRRHDSDYLRQTTYFTDANGMLVPHAAMGFGRSNSVSGGRPAQIVINNTQHDDFSPPHTSRSRRSSGYDDDSWDERAHSPRRHRDRSRDRSRRRSRDRSRDRSRNRSRDSSHERRQHSHHRHGHQSRSPSPFLDLETERKLAELKRKEEEEAARERAEQERILAEARKTAEKKEQEEFKKRVLQEAEREKFEKEMKEKKKKEEEDRVFKARLKEMYRSQGYSEESIEIMIKDAEKKKHGSHSPHSPHATGGHNEAMVHLTESTKIVSLDRPTYIKVHRKHLDPRTLNDYGLPWEWEDADCTYIIIKRWISDKDQETLFEHTRKLHQQRLAITNAATIEMVKKEHGKLKLVRERSPARSRSRNRAFLLM